MEIHVAQNGDDSHSGTIDSPLATLHTAQKTARRARREDPHAVVEVVVHNGTYYLGNPLVLTVEDSGGPDNPVAWRSAEVGKATISGGLRLECKWERYRDGILRCRLTELSEEQLAFTQLYVNGKRQIRARYPNGDSRSPSTAGYLTASGADDYPHTKVFFDPASFSEKSWDHPEKAILHIFPGNYWGNMQYRLRDVDRGSGTLGLGEGGWQLLDKGGTGAATGIGEKSRFFIENIFEELDAPGEWYFDEGERCLYWMPESGIEPETAIVEVSSLEHLIEISGTKEQPVRDIQLDGFSFVHSEATFLQPYIAPSCGDWTIYPGGAIRTQGAESITIENCSFEGIGGNGVYLADYAKNVTVSGCRFVDIGESAVCLVGKSHLDLSGITRCKFCGHETPWSWSEPSDEIPTNCTVSNNLIHDIGVFGKQTAGVFLALSSTNSISHNHIYNTPRAGVCINDGFYGGHIVEYNDIHDTVRETGDHGPFNSWGREPFWCHAQSHGPSSHPAGDVLTYAKNTTVIRNNRFRDYSGWGIDLDDGSSNYHVYANLCIGISVKLREGDYRLVENNIFYKGVNPPGFHMGYEGNCDRFVHNIIVMDTGVDVPEVDANFQKGKSRGSIYHLIAPPATGEWFEEWDHNLFYNDLGTFKATVRIGRNRPAESVVYSLEQWRNLGFDVHSQFADPLFVDPENGDFRLRPDSKALELGFTEFALDSFGLTNEFELSRD